MYFKNKVYCTKERIFKWISKNWLYDILLCRRFSNSWLSTSCITFKLILIKKFYILVVFQRAGGTLIKAFSIWPHLKQGLCLLWDVLVKLPIPSWPVPFGIPCIWHLIFDIAHPMLTGSINQYQYQSWSVWFCLAYLAININIKINIFEIVSCCAE